MAATVLSLPACEFLHGCLRCEDVGKGWQRPWRVTPRQLEALSKHTALNPQLFRDMATCTAGITLELITSATRIALEIELDTFPEGTRAVTDRARLDPLSPFDGVSCECDGTFLGVCKLASTQPSLVLDLSSFSALRHHVRLWLPSLCGCTLRAIVADADMEPLSARPYLLVLGDSLAQGFVAGDPALSWVSLLADKLHCDVVNQGIGGQVFQRASLADLGDVVPNPCAIVVEFGANYRYEPCSAAQVRHDAQSYFDKVRSLWPATPLWVLTPTWHDEVVWPTHPASCWDAVASIIEDVVGTHALRGRDTIQVVDGLGLMDHSANMVVDEGHPNQAGSAQIAHRLYAAMK